jgi:hypothetical protein
MRMSWLTMLTTQPCSTRADGLRKNIRIFLRASKCSARTGDQLRITLGRGHVLRSDLMLRSTSISSTEILLGVKARVPPNLRLRWSKRKLWARNFRLKHNRYKNQIRFCRQSRMSKALSQVCSLCGILTTKSTRFNRLCRNYSKMTLCWRWKVW